MIPLDENRGSRLGRGMLALLVALGALAADASQASRGDAAWLRRAEGAREGRARPGAALEAVRTYETELEARPASVELRWKLLRAYHFAGDFTALSGPEQLDLFERAIEVAESSLTWLAAETGSDTRLDELDAATLAARVAASDVSGREVARLYFWAAIDWGAWSQRVGLLRAVREGVANRVERYASVTIALEPAYEEGGALRLLGRLHAELPKVPFVTGWVSREQSIPLLERAHAMAPTHPGNRLLLALTLLELADARRDEALGYLESVSQLTPRPSSRVEDMALREEARRRLAVLRQATR